MDLFKLGLRNLLGIMLPGTILILTLTYSVFSAEYCWTLKAPDLATLESLQWSGIVLFLLLSYFVGSIFRLQAANRIDDKSSLWNLKDFWLREKLPLPWGDSRIERISWEVTRLFKRIFLWKKTPFPWEESDVVRIFREVRENFLKERGVQTIEDLLTRTMEKMDPSARKLFGDRPLEKIVRLFDNWLWLSEKFPYPASELRFLAFVFPREMETFFQDYRLASRNSRPLRSGTQLFNYYKTVILHSSRTAGDQLAEDVTTLEGHTRFYAGTYYGLLYSSVVLPALIAFQIITLGLHHGWALPPEVVANSVAAVVLWGACLVTMRSILKRFRFLRLKEVDAVHYAFYLVHRHPETCPQCSRRIESAGDDRFSRREELLMEAYRQSGRPDGSRHSMGLERLVSLMKERSREAQYLSSLYFAGNEENHPYFLKNDRIAVGLAVLPEDLEKAGSAKAHPHQQEVILVIRGVLKLELDHQGEKTEKSLGEGELLVIPPGQCHRVLPDPPGDAVYVFVKTNPAVEPRSAQCVSDPDRE